MAAAWWGGRIGRRVPPELRFLGGLLSPARPCPPPGFTAVCSSTPCPPSVHFPLCRLHLFLHSALSLLPLSFLLLHFNILF